ncbi:MAG: hypothetical protein JKY23_04345 [Nitrospinaceae bacterium]|nr:hypothetical protein [Nitrospinaceae bacterium]
MSDDTKAASTPASGPDLPRPSDDVRAAIDAVIHAIPQSLGTYLRSKWLELEVPAGMDQETFFYRLRVLDFLGKPSQVESKSNTLDAQGKPTLSDAGWLEAAKNMAMVEYATRHGLTDLKVSEEFRGMLPSIRLLRVDEVTTTFTYAHPDDNPNPEMAILEPAQLPTKPAPGDIFGAYAWHYRETGSKDPVKKKNA